MLIDLVAGARPNFMKVAPIVRVAKAHSGLKTRLVHTGQHYDDAMSEVFFRDLGIPAPDVHLAVGSAPHGAQTGRILERYEAHLLGSRPDGVVVVGDVNSTMACTLAAVKLGIRVAHVEAGLRSFDRTMPEEVNRVVTDALADLLLVSEPSGIENLKREGVEESRIVFVGNVMIDPLMRELPAARALGMPAKLGLRPKGYAYVTLHRPSNVDEETRLGEVLRMLEGIAKMLPVVFPVHPRTRERARRYGLEERLSAGGLRALEPLGYRESLGVMSEARFVLTDSGGVQEETTVLGIPCLTLRPNTERPVTVEKGTNTVVGEECARVAPLVEEILAGRGKRGGPIEGWDGKAAERIVEAIVKRW